MASINAIDRENIDNATRLLAYDYIDYSLRQQGFEWPNRPTDLLPDPPTRLILAMRTLADDIKDRYVQKFGNDGLLSALSITASEDLSWTFSNVFNTIFRPNGQEIEVTGGRLFTLFAFAGLLAAECVRQELPERIDQVADLLVVYVQTRLSDWIDSKGGWEALIFSYGNRRTAPADRTNKTARSILGGFAVLGVATLAAMFASRQ